MTSRAELEAAILANSATLLLVRERIGVYMANGLYHQLRAAACREDYLESEIRRLRSRLEQIPKEGCCGA